MDFLAKNWSSWLSAGPERLFVFVKGPNIAGPLAWLLAIYDYCVVFFPHLDILFLLANVVVSLRCTLTLPDTVNWSYCSRSCYCLSSKYTCEQKLLQLLQSLSTETKSLATRHLLLSSRDPAKVRSRLIVNHELRVSRDSNYQQALRSTYPAQQPSLLFWPSLES